MKRWSAFPYMVSAAGGIKSSRRCLHKKTRSMYLRFFTSKKIGVPLCDALIFVRESSAAKPRCFPSP